VNREDYAAHLDRQYAVTGDIRYLKAAAELRGETLKRGGIERNDGPKLLRMYKLIEQDGLARYTAARSVVDDFGHSANDRESEIERLARKYKRTPPKPSEWDVTKADAEHWLFKHQRTMDRLIEETPGLAEFLRQHRRE